MLLSWEVDSQDWPERRRWHGLDARFVVDARQPRNAPAEHSHGYLTRDGMGPLELLSIGRDEVMGYGAKIIDGTVSSIDRLPGGSFRITSSIVPTVSAGGCATNRLVFSPPGLTLPRRP